MKKHLLREEELIELRAIQTRKTVTTADREPLEAILQRMNPKYTIGCDTCLDTIAAEALGLIRFADKQLGYPLYKYVGENEVSEEPADTTDTSTENVVIEPVTSSAPAIEPADTKGQAETIQLTPNGLTDVGLISYMESKLAVTLTAEVKAMTGEKLHAVACEILKITPEELIEIIAPAVDGVAPISEKQKKFIELNHEGINGLSNVDLIKYVFQETGVELSEHASRGDLISSADDLLDEKEEQAVKLSVPQGGVGRMKNVDLIAYIEQETGTKYDQLERPELLKLAKQSKANEKSD